MEEVLHINASAVELSATLPHRPGGGKPSGKFCTDTEISGGILGGNRDLQAWSGPEHSELNLRCAAHPLAAVSFVWGLSVRCLHRCGISLLCGIVVVHVLKR